MQQLYRQGAFQGYSPDQAYFVKCGYETMTQEDINQGIVRVDVGFAPLRSAAFVLMRITQKTGRRH